VLKGVVSQLLKLLIMFNTVRLWMGS